MIILGTNSIKDTGYNVANSCRFDDGSSAYLSKADPGASGNRKTWTLSLWFKRGNLGTVQTLFSSGKSHILEGFVRINASDRLEFKNDGQYGGEASPTRVLRDVGAWYHLCWSVDATQGSNDNRWKIYLNGTLIPASEYSSVTIANADGNILDFDSNASDLAVGRRERTDADYWDGYISEVVFIDGTQAAVTSFGEFDEDSPTIWKPIDVSGLSLGTNGFYLDFEDSSDLGADAKGSFDFTANNLAATDQSTDTPTNNFCTMSPLWNFANNVTLSEGNCKIVSSGSWSGAGATIGLTAGKWYYEVKMTTLPGGGGNGRTGFFDSEVTYTSGNIFQQTNGTTYFYNEDGGEVQKDNSITTADYGQVAQGSILGVALNMDDKQVTFYDDNVAIITNLALSTNGTSGIVIPSSGINTETQEYNFGNPPYSLTSAASDENGYGNFEFAPPSGYLAICSKNLGSDGG